MSNHHCPLCSTLDQLFDETLRRVRAEFERSGEIHSGFECVTDAENFYVPANWPDRNAKPAACAALRDSFRRRGVNRYLFASEAWAPDDPDRVESVQVIAVERNGPQRYAFAEITRNGGTATLGPWQVNGNVPPSWLFELLEDGHSDRAPKAEPPPARRISTPDFQELVDQHLEHSVEIYAHFQDLVDQYPEQTAEWRDLVQMDAQLKDLILDLLDQMRKGANGSILMAIFLAVESVLRSIVKDMESPKGLGQFARFLRDHPDKFPMFSTEPNLMPSQQHVRSCAVTLRRFSCEKRELGHPPFAIYLAFMNMYIFVGTEAIGALNLADRIEHWAKLRQHICDLENWDMKLSFPKS